MQGVRVYNPGRETRWGQRPVRPVPPLRPEELIPETGPDLPVELKDQLAAVITAAIAARAFGSPFNPTCYAAGYLAGALKVKRPLGRAIRWAFDGSTELEIREQIGAVAAIVPEVQLVATWIREQQ